MTGETSWTECATQVMEGKEEAWFTVQAIVSEIRDRNMKPSMHHMPMNEACRSLRSCLRHHAKKENGRFVRKNSDTLIQYALRKGLERKKRSVQMARRPAKRHRPPDSAPQSIVGVDYSGGSVGGAVVVQVDSPDELLAKTNRPRQLSRDSITGSSAGFLLPSPTRSLLGPRRTLGLLAAGETSSRPVRKTRGRAPRERVRDRALVKAEETASSDIWFPPPSLPEPEELSPVLPRDGWSVAFLKSHYQQAVGGAKSDHTPNSPPSHVQGDRVVSRVMCAVNPDLPVTSDLSSSCDDSETETGSETEATPTETMETTYLPSQGSPRPQLPPHLPSLSSSSPHKQALPPSVAMATKRSEVSRQLAFLLSTSSPLVGENLKVLLGQRSFEALSQSQRQCLKQLLPSVDRDTSDRLQPVALNNSFFGSACREWQDQLALGLHGNSTGGRRGDKKPRNCGDWKDKYFESEWGQRDCKVEKSDAMFFPHDHNPPLSHTLSSTTSGFNSRSAPLPPPVPPPSRPPQKPGSTPSASKSVCSVRQRSPHTRHTSSAVRSKRDSHNPRNNFRILSPSSRKPVTSRNHLVLSNKNRISSRSSFLSPLPHKMSYTALIDALHKASRNNNNASWAIHLYVNPTNSDVSPLHVQHTHSVFHDHFSSLASPSVLPSAFLSSYPLVVSLPLSLHANLLRQRVVFSDHNYTPLTSDSQPTSLPLSLPRSLLPSPHPHTPSSCSSRKLALCSTCNSLYHLNCSHGNLCPSCTRPLS